MFWQVLNLIVKFKKIKYTKREDFNSKKWKVSENKTVWQSRLI